MNSDPRPSVNLGAADDDLAASLASIRERARASIDEAIEAAFRDCDALIKRTYRARLVAFLSDGETTPDDRPAEQPTSVPRSSARVIALRVLAQAPGPISYNDVAAAVTREGWTKAASDKIRTKLIKEELIVAEQGLYTLSDAGRKLSAGSG